MQPSGLERKDTNVVNDTHNLPLLVGVIAAGIAYTELGQSKKCST
jgi:hypothetical protein